MTAQTRTFSQPMANQSTGHYADKIHSLIFYGLLGGNLKALFHKGLPVRAMPTRTIVRFCPALSAPGRTRTHTFRCVRMSSPASPDSIRSVRKFDFYGWRS